MQDLWYSENYEEDVKFSVRVTHHLHSEKTPFQQSSLRLKMRVVTAMILKLILQVTNCLQKLTVL